MCVQDLFDFLKVKLEFRGRGRSFQEMSGKRQIFFFDKQCLEQRSYVMRDDVR